MQLCGIEVRRRQRPSDREPSTLGRRRSRVGRRGLFGDLAPRDREALLAAAEPPSWRRSWSPGSRTNGQPAVSRPRICTRSLPCPTGVSSATPRWCWATACSSPSMAAPARHREALLNRTCFASTRSCRRCRCCSTRSRSESSTQPVPGPAAAESRGRRRAGPRAGRAGGRPVRADQPGPRCGTWRATLARRDERPALAAAGRGRPAPPSLHAPRHPDHGRSIGTPAWSTTR